jgi:hypothetical protein
MPRVFPHDFSFSWSRRIPDALASNLARLRSCTAATASASVSHFVRRALAAFIAFEVDGSVEEYADSLRRLAAHLRDGGGNAQEPHSHRHGAASEGELATGVDRATKMLAVYEQLALLLQLHDAQLRP